ncbi:MAG: polyphosphate kinase 1, partial [Ruthenibacterium sp.]
AELVQTLNLQWADTVNAREMQIDGSYTKVKGKDGDEPIDSQLSLYQSLATVWPETLSVVPQQGFQSVKAIKTVQRTATPSRQPVKSPQKHIVRPHKKTLLDKLVGFLKK